MKKYIVSTLEQNIEFNLSGTRKLVIEPVIATEVSEVELRILKTRLGAQIKEVSVVADALPENNVVATTEEHPTDETETVQDASEDIEE